MTEEKRRSAHPCLVLLAVWGVLLTIGALRAFLVSVGPRWQEAATAAPAPTLASRAVVARATATSPVYGPAAPTTRPWWEDLPTSTPAPASPARCVPVQDAGDHVGEYQCICGVVVGTYQDPNSSAWFINFAYEPVGFYGMSFDWRWTGLEGRCVTLCGVVEEYGGRPEIVIREQEGQVFYCD